MTEPTAPSPAPAEPITESKPAAAKTMWHSAGWWASVGGIVAVISLVVTTIQLFQSDEPAATKPTGTTSTPTSTAAAPFTTVVKINEDTCNGATGFHVVPPSMVTAVRPAQNKDGDPAFANAPDAVFSDVIVTLQGTSGVATVLQGMKVHVVSRRAAEGVAYRNGAVECGGIAPAFFGIKLDHADAAAKPLPGRDGTPARAFPFKISDSDPEVLHIYGVADDCDCQWYVDIEWSSGGKTGTVTIDNGGQPFRTVGTKNIKVVGLTPDYQNWAQESYPPYNPMQ
ncbi:hypothetical protein Rhe02_58090 [Rhizocola hellebori]|uniref:Uncharacterized protein n=1 Tax=Rhizocola hellebori TaxID=1392758 RepID=A0A8J3QCZ3_9ACTN|nr:hypothetical protein [Rhizocola hellebori]GIH07742.1 hypothetical protein Rhe02_58090 [Rhizocola hellebori]